MSVSLQPHGLLGHQPPLFRGLSRKEYWSRLLFSFPGNFLDPGIELAAPAISLALQKDALLLSHRGEMVLEK